MVERIRAALLTYTGRIMFQIYGSVAVILSISATYYFRGRIIPIPPYYMFAVALVVAHSTLLGNQLFRQFVPLRARLIPGFGKAHWGLALGLTLFLTVLLALPLVSAAQLSFEGFPAWQDVSFTGLAVSLWFFGLVAFMTAYVTGSLVVFAGWAFLVGVGSTTVRSFFFQSTSNQNGAIPALFVINVIVSTALVWRIVHQDDESWEHRWRTARPGSEPQRRWWSGWSNEKSLDRISRPLKRDLWSELRHFQLSHKSSEPIARSAVFMIVMLWIVNVLFSASAASYIMLFLLLPILPVISSIKDRMNAGLQLDFMLPFKRKALVARLGGALFLSQMRLWTAYAVASVVVEWMPRPGVIHGFPSLLPFVTSLALQFPIFGIAMMGLLRREVKVTYIVLVFFMTLAIFVTNTGGAILKTLLIAGLAVIGMVLIWCSYRLWCEADI